MKTLKLAVLGLSIFLAASCNSRNADNPTNNTSADTGKHDEKYDTTAKTNNDTTYPGPEHVAPTMGNGVDTSKIK